MSQAQAGVGAVTVVAESEPKDGRPMHTDLFLAKLLTNDTLVGPDYREAIKAWVEGAWEEALDYVED